MTLIGAIIRGIIISTVVVFMCIAALPAAIYSAIEWLTKPSQTRS